MKKNEKEMRRRGGAGKLFFETPKRWDDEEYVPVPEFLRPQTMPPVPELLRPRNTAMASLRENMPRNTLHLNVIASIKDINDDNELIDFAAKNFEKKK